MLWLHTRVHFRPWAVRSLSLESNESRRHECDREPVTHCKLPTFSAPAALIVSSPQRRQWSYKNYMRRRQHHRQWAYLQTVGILANGGHTCIQWAYLQTAGILADSGHTCRQWAYLQTVGILADGGHTCMQWAYLHTAGILADGGHTCRQWPLTT
jgi:hypothetical protein